MAWISWMSEQLFGLSLTLTCLILAKAKVTGAQVGSAVHELMQRIPLDSSPSMAVLRSALAQVQADEAVKKQIQLPKIASFSRRIWGDS